MGPVTGPRRWCLTSSKTSGVDPLATAPAPQNNTPSYPPAPGAAMDVTLVPAGLDRRLDNPVVV